MTETRVARPRTSTFDLRITNGMVYDGLGHTGVRVNIYVLNNRISAVTHESREATETIDAGGLTVCPGFIDTHSHSDLKLISDPNAEAKITQGITTEIVGQDGFSVAPIKRADIREIARYLSGLAGELDEWKWSSFNSYLDCISENKPATNVASLVGNGTLRAATIGFQKKKANDQELQQMKEMLSVAMMQGALGLSSGLIYPPSLYADETELTELCKTVAQHEGIYVTHMRNEANQLIESVQETLRVAENSEVRLHISHHKAIGKANWGSTETTLKMIDEANKKGAKITCDTYPYTAGSTMLTALLPPWSQEGGPAALHERLANSTERERIRYDIENGLPGWESHCRLAGWDKIIVTYSKVRKDVEGKNIQEIAHNMKRSETDVVFDLLLEAQSAVSMLVFHISEDDIRRVITYESSTICTDGLLGGKPHPRAYGAFPRFIRRYVLGERLLTIENAIRKMTSLPASRFGLSSRGQITPGAFADIVIFDPNRISDRATYDDPGILSTGIEYVIVNGQIALNRGKQTDIRAGRVIRREEPTDRKRRYA